MLLVPGENPEASKKASSAWVYERSRMQHMEELTPTMAICIECCNDSIKSYIANIPLLLHHVDCTIRRSSLDKSHHWRIV